MHMHNFIVEIDDLKVWIRFIDNLYKNKSVYETIITLLLWWLTVIVKKPKTNVCVTRGRL